ncbi:hypothetical protein [Alteromonas gilva]|uniref:Uncharacterized protein n=1 Tax=Alteromonas gilva TaxID=2987522 RepID=A0ABT5L6Z2_9ALTE|nr:hypothetical protein [Alteromonas gilva]MDC8831592.1 hypothetical protein [Alteromonas gilva]
MKTIFRKHLTYLKLALDNSGVDYELSDVEVPSLPQSRSGKLIDQQAYGVLIKGRTDYLPRSFIEVQSETLK